MRQVTPGRFWFALPALLLGLAAFLADPLLRPDRAVVHAQGSGQLVAITEDNGYKILSSIWALNDARDVEPFLEELQDFSSDYRSLVSYAAPDTPIEVGCPFSGSIELRGQVADDSIGVVTGETTLAEFRDCRERGFLDIELTRNGMSLLTVVDSNEDGFSFDFTNDYTAVVDSPALSEPVRATFTGTKRYAVLSTEAAATLTATSDRFSVMGSTQDGAEYLDVRAYMTTLIFTRTNGVLNYAKNFLGRFEGTALGGAVIVTTDEPLTGPDREVPAFPVRGGFSAEGAGGSTVSLETLGGMVFLYVDADGDGSDDDLAPVVMDWPAFEALAD